MSIQVAHHAALTLPMQRSSAELCLDRPGAASEMADKSAGEDPGQWGELRDCRRAHTLPVLRIVIHLPSLGPTAMARVVVADAERNAAESLGLLLSLSQYDVAVVIDGQEAIEVTKVFRPHFVTLELEMPGVDGWQAARSLARARPNGLIAMIALSCFISFSLIADGLRLC